MKVRYTVPAQVDLDDIYSFVSENNPFAAERIKRQIRVDAELLGELPYIARESDYPGIRIRKVRRYPYLIFYSVQGGRGAHLACPPWRAPLALGRRRLV